MILRRLLQLSAVAASIAFCPVLRAAEPPSSAEVAAANDAFAAGKRAADGGDYKKARAYFLQAYAVLPEPIGLWNLAVAEKKGGYLGDAVKHFAALLADPSPEAARNKDKARAYLNEIAGHLEVRAPNARSISVDGGALSNDQARDGIYLLVGTHKVAIDGQVRQLEIVAGNKTVTYADPSSPTTTTPEASFDDVDRYIDRGGSTTTETNPARIWVTVGLGGVAAALLGTGIFFSIKSSGSKDDANALGEKLRPNGCAGVTSNECTSLSNKVNDANSQHTTSLLMYGGAGLFAAGAAAAWLLIPAHKEGRPSQSASPLVGPGMLGAQWTTTF